MTFFVITFGKQINLQKAVKHNKRKKLISSINILRAHKTNPNLVVGLG